MRPGLFRRMRLSIKTRRRQYITVNTDTPENPRSRSALLRSVMFVTALCMTVLVAAVGYSAVKYADEYRSTHSHNGTYDEPNTVKRQYIVPSGTASGADEYRPDGYSENIGSALAARMEENRGDVTMKYETVIDSTNIVTAFNKTYPLSEEDGAIVYWSDFTAYQRYLMAMDDIVAELERGELLPDEAKDHVALLRDDYAMTMLDYRNAGSGWISERRAELGAIYVEISDGKYYARLLASEIHALADEGFVLLGVGNESAGISGDYEKYLDGTNNSLLWYCSRCRPDELMTVECRIRYADGYPTVPETNLLNAFEKLLDRADIPAERIDTESVRSARVRLESDGYTAAVCRMELTRDEALRLMDSAPDCALSYIFTDDALLAEYQFEVYGDGFAYRTELVPLSSENKNM